MEKNAEDIVDLRFDSGDDELGKKEKDMRDLSVSPQLPPIRVKSDLVIAEQ